MTGDAKRPKIPPTLKEKAQADLEARLLREAAALRANLKRRKQQVRDRAEKAPEDRDDTPSD